MKVYRTGGVISPLRSRNRKLVRLNVAKSHQMLCRHTQSHRHTRTHTQRSVPAKAIICQKSGDYRRGQEMYFSSMANRTIWSRKSRAIANCFHFDAKRASLHSASPDYHWRHTHSSMKNTCLWNGIDVEITQFENRKERAYFAQVNYGRKRLKLRYSCFLIDVICDLMRMPFRFDAIHANKQTNTWTDRWTGALGRPHWRNICAQLSTLNCSTIDDAKFFLDFSVSWLPHEVCCEYERVLCKTRAGLPVRWYLSIVAELTIDGLVYWFSSASTAHRSTAPFACVAIGNAVANITARRGNRCVHFDNVRWTSEWWCGRSRQTSTVFDWFHGSGGWGGYYVALGSSVDRWTVFGSSGCRA